MNADEYFQSMQSLSTRYIEEYTRAMQRYAEMFTSVAQSRNNIPTMGDFSQLSDMQKRYSDFVISQSPQVITRLSEASISYYSTLADLGLQTLNGYFDSVVATMNSSAQPVTESPGNPANELLFHGLNRESASNAFLISNNRDEAIDVSFDMLEVKNRDTGHSFKPTAKFTPAKCRLGANSERVIQCTVPLTGEFEANQTYDGSIAVVGFPEMAMRINVQVEENAKAKPVKSNKRKKAATVKPTKKTRKKTVPGKRASKR